MINSPRCVSLLFALLLAAISLASTPAAASGMPADQVRGTAADADKCPLRASDLDKVTPYRWQFAKYSANVVHIPSVTVRVDLCQLLARDQKGALVNEVMMNVAKGAQAEAFAKHWHDVCAGSLVPAQRGKVQPLPGVQGGQQCVTAKGTSSNYWIEAPGRTVQLELVNDDAEALKLYPKILAAVIR